MKISYFFVIFCKTKIFMLKYKSNEFNNKNKKMKDFLEKYKKQKIIWNFLTILWAFVLAFSVNFLVLDWNNFSKNLTTSVLDSNKIEQKADFYLEKNSDKLVIKNSKKMENVKSLAFSLSYDFSNLEINELNSNFWKVENLWEKNSGIETFILNLDNKAFEKNEILVEINFSKKDEKLSSIINLFNSNFTDNKNEIYELTTSGISF